MRRKPSLDSQTLPADMERLWLHYFNNTLLREGLLSEEEHRKLQIMIVQRKRGKAR